MSVDDPAVAPMLARLLEVYRAESAKVADPPKYVSIRPGVQFVAGISENGQGETIADEVFEGAIWLRVVSMYPTDTFPQQDTGFRNEWPGSLAVVIEMGVVRCVPYQGEADGTMPTSEQHIAAATAILADVAAMRRTAVAMRAAGYDLTMGQYQPIPAEGNAGGGTLHLTVRVPFCEIA